MERISRATPIAFDDPLPDAVDTVVIGAGIVGTATAYFLARQGHRVLLAEKGRVAGEQSSRNWGWIRQQGRDRAELPIMMESNRIWRGLAEETGEADVGFTMCGCIYLAEDEAQMARFEQWRETALEHQLDTRLLRRDEIATHAPGIQGEWIGGMLTPSDGRSEPFVAVPALARAARRAGAVVKEDCAVRTLDVHAGELRGVHTEHGPVRSETVVLAGGAWSTYFASNAGLDLPQLSVRSTVARTHPVEHAPLPNVSMPGLALRRRDDGGYTVTSGDLAEHFVTPRSFRYFGKYLRLLKSSARDVRILPWAPSGYPGSWSAKSRWSASETTPFETMRVLDPTPSPKVRRRILERLPQRAPWLAAAGLADIWAGMIDVTPDAVPYVCTAPQPRGLLIATGMSGHGFGIGPAIGRIVADLAMGRAPGHDLDRFRYERFHDGSAIVPGPY